MERYPPTYSTLDDEPPMHGWLQERYGTLFEIYGAGASTPVINTKERITEYSQENPETLRSDAAYFLLVNFDEMIIRPHAGYVPGFDPSDAPEGWPQRDITERVNRALDVVLGSLDNAHEKPVSAHQVMRTIDANWNQLAEIMEWA